MFTTKQLANYTEEELALAGDLSELIQKGLGEMGSFYKSLEAVSEKIRTKDDGLRAGKIRGSVFANEKYNCIRRNIYELQDAKTNSTPSVRKNTAGLFMEGWMLHLKWQAMFLSAGWSGLEDIETTHISSRLAFTPDALVTWREKRYVVEVKSSNTRRFKDVEREMSVYINQLGFYMWRLKIPRGIVLVENKDTQEIFVKIIGENDIAYTIFKSQKMMKTIGKHIKSGTLPSRLEGCGSPKPKAEARECQYWKTCYEAHSSD